MMNNMNNMNVNNYIAPNPNDHPIIRAGKNFIGNAVNMYNNGMNGGNQGNNMNGMNQGLNGPNPQNIRY